MKNVQVDQVVCVAGLQGPNMIVDKVADTGTGTKTAWCLWFDNNGALHSSCFPERTLQLVLTVEQVHTLANTTRTP
jgi:uncharacterized protein YodC (DUF2158 family)